MTITKGSPVHKNRQLGKYHDIFVQLEDIASDKALIITFDSTESIKGFKNIFYRYRDKHWGLLGNFHLVTKNGNQVYIQHQKP